MKIKSERHPLFGALMTLKSRNGFLRWTAKYGEPKTNVGFWRKIVNQHWMESLEQVAPSCDKLGKLEDTKQTTYGHCKVVRYSQWILFYTNFCECVELQTTQHMYTCSLFPAQLWRTSWQQNQMRSTSPDFVQEMLSFNIKSNCYFAVSQKNVLTLYL